MEGPDSPSLDQELSAGRPATFGARAIAAVRGLAVDLSPLRESRDYRLLWTGQLVSTIGQQITMVAVFYQVFALTGSAAAVGLVGLAQLVPQALVAVGFGSVIDRVDRRRLMILADVGLVVSTTVLLLGALADRPPVALVYAAVGVAAGVGAIAGPTRTAIIPNLVPAERLAPTFALNQVMWQTAQIVGPAIGGIIIAGLGLAWAYAIDVASYGAGILTAVLMSPQPPRGVAAVPATGLRAVREAFAFLRGRRVIQSTFVADLIAMIFGMPRALFPILAVVQFHRGPEVVGALFSAIAAGALAGALTAGWVGRVRRHGLAVICAVAVWGLGVVAFGLVGDRLALALVFLALAGAADVVSVVFRGTILQSSVPDSLRGRLSALHILNVSGGPRLGDIEAGLVAEAFTPRISVVSGGIACVAGVALLGLFVPEFVRYRAGAPETPTRDRGADSSR